MVRRKHTGAGLEPSRYLLKKALDDNGRNKDRKIGTPDCHEKFIPLKTTGHCVILNLLNSAIGKIRVVETK